jgi:hypothetical protein
MTWVVLEVDQNQDLYHPERTAREDIHDSQRLEWDSHLTFSSSVDILSSS